MFIDLRRHLMAELVRTSRTPFAGLFMPHFVLQPWYLLLMSLSSIVNRKQQLVIEYLRMAVIGHQPGRALFVGAYET